jgi:hypothetical protein
MNGYEAIAIADAVLAKTLAQVDDPQQRQSAGRVLIGRIREMCGIRPSDSQQMAAVNIETVLRGKDDPTR